MDRPQAKQEADRCIQKARGEKSGTEATKLLWKARYLYNQAGLSGMAKWVDRFLMTPVR